MMRRMAAALYGFLAYLAFLLPIGYLVGFLADVGVPKSVDRGAGPLGPALGVDLALLTLFGIQHSVMARDPFKRALERWVPGSLERSTYVLASGATLSLVYWLWRPIPAVLWDVTGGTLGVAAWVAFASGLGLAVWATFALSHFHLFGVAQVAAYVQAREHPRMLLRRTVLYRIVRHPMTAGLLLLLWSTPRMTLGHLVFTGGMTVYSLMGTVLEERDLLRRFGESYRRYRREVPALLPMLRPGVLVPRSVGPATELAVIALGLALAGAVPLRGEGGGGAPSGPRPGSETMELAGTPRTFEVYDPAPGSPRRRPLVLALHGSGGDAGRLRGFLGGALERIVERRGWLLVYPEAVAGRWNDCRAATVPPARAAGISDVAFLQALVDRMVRERGADPERVFVLGYSGGGHMAFRLALEAGDLVRAIAVFGANLPRETELACEDRGVPVPALLVNGGRDPVNPHEGGEVIGPFGQALGAVRSAEESVRYFRERPGGAEASLVILETGGHTVPGPDSRFPRLVGSTDREYRGVEEAADFFARQTDNLTAGNR